ncbi:MAG: 2-oxo-4-hydroxy-4-carboxy-5-ureidoimidazoline decarboxylase [Enterobacteriaceae bacterium]|nr:2-oxo-4-hydroxy-4-carboxy-5-ureidoimidazoline decarboxylase [Enterobacteriaceae bacterium]
MIALNHFNQLSTSEALAVLQPCVALPSWSAALVAARPYASLAGLRKEAYQQTLGWGAAELETALGAHPRIGEKPAGPQTHAAFSRQEQSAVDDRDARLTQALKEGNARYEARFGRVFLIRAKGRSGEEILEALAQRLAHSDDEELRITLEQLREITLLRLEGVIGE